MYYKLFVDIHLIFFKHRLQLNMKRERERALPAALLINVMLTAALILYHACIGTEASTAYPDQTLRVAFIGVGRGGPGGGGRPLQ